MGAGERTAGATDVATLFAAVAAIGPFFAVATGPEPPGGGWVPLRAAGGDPLTARIAAIRDALGTDTRVAASTAFQGLAAQVVAPLFAAVAVEGVLPVAPAAGDTAADDTAAGDTASWRPAAAPDGSPTTTRDHEAVGGLADALCWRPGGDGPWLWWSGGGRAVACPDPGVLADVLLVVLVPLVAAVRAAAPVAERVLWSNVASAVANARRLSTAARPAAAARATAVAERLLAVPLLAATTQLRAPEPPDRAWTFRRRSCCLFYRVAGAGICGDCVLQERHVPGG